MDLLRVFKPSALESVFVVVLSVLVLAVSSFEQIISRFIIQDSVKQDFLQTLNNYSQLVLDALSTVSFLADVTTLLVWAGVGAVVYVLAWLIMSNIVDVSAHVLVSHRYVMPVTSSRREYWLIFLARKLFVISLALVMALYGVVIIQVVWPAVIVYFQQNLDAGWWLLPRVSLIMGVLYLAGHIGVVMWRLLFFKPS